MNTAHTYEYKYVCEINKNRTPFKSNVISKRRLRMVKNVRVAKIDVKNLFVYSIMRICRWTVSLFILFVPCKYSNTFAYVCTYATDCKYSISNEEKKRFYLLFGSTLK